RAGILAEGRGEARREPDKLAKRKRNDFDGVTAKDLGALILSLGGRPIAFHATYARLPGCNVNCAVLLSQMVYWSNKDSTRAKNGWFFKTRESWAEETGLSLDEIDTARSKLRKCGVLKEELRGIPARTYYFVNCARLAELIQSSSGKSPELD